MAAKPLQLVQVVNYQYSCLIQCGLNVLIALIHPMYKNVLRGTCAFTATWISPAPVQSSWSWLAVPIVPLPGKGKPSRRRSLRLGLDNGVVNAS